MDGDALTQAQFKFPNKVSLCVGIDGSIYVSDLGNHAIRKITPQGMVTTLAGNGTTGFVDGQGAAARFRFPAGITIDNNGNVYVADGLNHAIRKITPEGLVTTYAGTGVPGDADGAANASQFFVPSGLVIDGTGNIFVADLGNERIRKITTGGTVSTIAGNFSGYLDGPASTALFARPAAITIDNNGNLYVAEEDNHRIRKISTGFVVTTVAGSSPVGTGVANGGFADGNALTQAQFNTPSGLVVDNTGNIFIADRFNHRIRKISPQGIVTTIAGSTPLPSNTGGFNDGPGVSAMFNQPSDICHDNFGNLFVADLINNRIRKIEFLEQFVTIEGTVYIDNDTSCNLTTGDLGTGNRMIEFEHSTGKYYVFSASIGNYQFTGPPGSYNVRLVNTPVIKETCQQKVYNVSLAAGQSSTTLNFFILPFCELGLSITYAFPYPLIDPCPGFPLTICALIINKGTIDLDPAQFIQPVIPFNITPIQNISFSTPLIATSSGCALGSSIASFSTSTGTFEWTITSIIPAGGICKICIDAAIPPNISLLNQLSIFRVETPFFHCVGTNEDVHNVGNGIQTIKCSVDPNAKLLVFPNGCGELGKIKRDEQLYYKIHFQNTGNAPASNIIILDTLDIDFDIFSLFLLPTSHPLTSFEVLPSNVLKWTFIDIQLPDSIADPEGSKGFVQYQINHLQGLVEGSQLINRAAIIFDLNEPVITNTTTNTIFDNIGPSISFDFTRQCGVNAYNFNYTGSTDIATILWDFGEDAIPNQSTILNPTGIKFLIPGKKIIQLFTEDTAGCFNSITDTIEIEDISCGKNKDKVLVCHVTQAKQPKQLTLCIDNNDAVNHVNHGDCIGPCLSGSLKTQSNENEIYLDTTITNQEINIYVNPYNNSTTITLLFPYDGILKILITDVSGREVFSYDNFIQNDQNYSFIVTNNPSLSTGIYFCKVTLNNTVHVKKFIKVR